MRKATVFLFMTLWIFLIFINGCSDGDEKSAGRAPAAQGDTVNSKPAAFTVEEIKEKYGDAKIKNIENIGERFVLVESQQETFANKFDVYDLKTGERDTLPTGFEFVTLDEAVNENYFIFSASGRNSESVYGNFPYRIRCIRSKQDANQGNRFTALFEEKYFPLEASVGSGSKAGSVLTEVMVFLDGLEVLFSPAKGKEAEFYTAATDIPPTKTAYDKDKKRMTFEIGTDRWGEKLQGMKKVNIEGNPYVTSYEITQEDGKTYLAVSLKDYVKEYTVRIKRLPDTQWPYFMVLFKGEQ